MEPYRSRLGRLGLQDAAHFRDRYSRIPEDEIQRLVGHAKNQLGSPWRNPTVEQFHGYFTTGERANYDGSVEEDHARLALMALIHWLSPTDQWIDEIVYGLRALVERVHWHLPAHERDRPKGGAFAPVDNNRSLDMCAAEIGALCALTVALHGEVIERKCPGLTDAVVARVHASVLARYLGSDAPWIGPLVKPTNWNPWINHQVLVIALLLTPEGFDHPVSQKIRSSLREFWQALPDDGGVEEGLTYWWQGAAHFLEAVRLFGDLEGAGSRALNRKKLRALLRFPAELAATTTSALTFGDSDRWLSPNLGWSLVASLARNMGDTDLEVVARGLAQHLVPIPSMTDSLERSMRSVLDDLWASESKAVMAPLSSASVLYPSAGFAVGRARIESVDWIVGVTVGNNGQLHNHLDVGSFCLWVDECPVVIDLGAPTYRSLTFGPDRYLQWGLSSDWHSVPAINGCDQLEGADRRAIDVSCNFGDAGTTTLSARIHPAYPRESKCAAYDRVFLLGQEGKGMSLLDGWTPEPGERLEVVSKVVLPGTARREAVGARVPTRAGSVLIEVLDSADILLQRHAVADPRLAQAWGTAVTRLLVAPRDDGIQSLSMRFTYHRARM